jgi:hypothetical protein
MILPLITAGVLAGFVFVGFWGDVAIGALIVGAARLGEAVATTIARTWHRTRRGLSGRTQAERRAPASPVGVESGQR